MCLLVLATVAATAAGCALGMHMLIVSLILVESHLALVQGVFKGCAGVKLAPGLHWSEGLG